MNAGDASTRERLPLAPLAGLCLLALLVRGVLVLTLAPVFFHGEELEKGAAARAMLTGLDLAWPQHAYHLYEGGGFVVSHLEALAFLAVGENVLAIKLVGLLLSLLVLCGGYLLAGRLFGARAALVAGLLLLLAPRPFQLLSLLALGIHLEACLFLALVLERGWALLRRGRARDGLLLGLVSGLGIHFSYQLVPVVGYVGLVLLIRAPRRVFGAAGVAGLLGLLVGATPFLLTWWSVGPAVFDIHGQGLAEGAVRRLAPLEEFLRSILLEGSPTARLLHGLYLLAPLVAGVALLVGRGTRSAAGYLLGFLAVWLLAYLVSGFAVGRVYHHFVWMRLAPAFFVGTVLLAAAAARSWLLSVPLVLLGGVQTVAIVVDSAPVDGSLRELTTTRGFDPAGYLVKVLPRVGVDPLHLRRLAALVPGTPPWLVTDLTRAAWTARPDARTVEDLREALPGRELEVARGLGGWVWQRGGRELEGALAFARGMGEPMAGALQEALGFRGATGAFTAEGIAAELEALPVDPALEPYLRGVGERIHRLLVVSPYGTPRFTLRPGAALEWIAERREDQREALRAGFEASRRAWTLDR